MRLTARVSFDGAAASVFSHVGSSPFCDIWQKAVHVSISKRCCVQATETKFCHLFVYVVSPLVASSTLFLPGRHLRSPLECQTAGSSLSATWRCSFRLSGV